jgi:hypothetical protein
MLQKDNSGSLIDDPSLSAGVPPRCVKMRLCLDCGEAFINHSHRDGENLGKNACETFGVLRCGSMGTSKRDRQSDDNFEGGKLFDKLRNFFCGVLSGQCCDGYCHQPVRIAPGNPHADRPDVYP